MEQVINTKIIQVQSVINFMHELGYQYMQLTNGFSSGSFTNKTRKFVSFKTAVLLHNGSFMDWHGECFREPFHDIPTEWFHAAHKAKVVHVAKLQHSYKKGLIVQDHRVAFVHQDNAELLLKGE